MYTEIYVVGIQSEIRKLENALTRKLIYNIPYEF